MSNNTQSVWKDVVTVCGFLMSSLLAAGSIVVLAYNVGLISEKTLEKYDLPAWGKPYKKK